MKKRKAFNRLVTMIAVVALLLSSVIFPVDATGTKASAETSSDEDADTDISDHKNGWFFEHRLVSVINSKKGGRHTVYKYEDGIPMSLGYEGLVEYPEGKDFSYVYLGKCENNPLKFRILSREGLRKERGKLPYAKGLVLDGDSLVRRSQCDEGLMNNIEKESLVHIYVGGGEMFKDTRSELYNSHHPAQQWVQSCPEGPSSIYVVDYGVDGKVFPLSLGELAAYYGSETRLVNERPCGPYGLQKGDEWTPRSYFGVTPDDCEKGRLYFGPAGYPLRAHDNLLGYLHIQADGGIANGSGYYYSPACVVDHSAIVFSRLVSGKEEKPNAEYKLSLKDKNLNITGEEEVSISDNKATIPFNVTVGEGSEGVSQVSVLMLDGKYQDGNPDKISIKYHTKLADVKASGSGSATFTLPENYDPRWKTYIVAEKINGEHESDFAGTPFRVKLTANDGFLATAFSSPKVIIIIAGTAVILIGAVFILALNRSKKKITVKTNDTPEE